MNGAIDAQWRRRLELAVAGLVALASVVAWLQFTSHSAGTLFIFVARPVLVLALGTLVLLGRSWVRWVLLFAAIGTTYWFISAIGITQRGLVWQVAFAVAAVTNAICALALFLGPTSRAALFQKRAGPSH